MAIKFPDIVKFDDVNIDTQINVVSDTESVSGKRNVILGDQVRTIVDLRTIPLTETQDRTMQVFLNNIKKYGVLEMDLSDLGIFKPVVDELNQLKVTYGEAPTYTATPTGGNTINVDTLAADSELPVGVGSYIQIQEGDGTIRDKLHLVTQIDTLENGYKLTISPTLDSSLISQPETFSLRQEIDYTFNTSDTYTYRDADVLEPEGRSTYIFSNAQGNVATYTYAADGSETYTYSGNLTDTYVFQFISYVWDEDQSYTAFAFSDLGQYSTWTRGSLGTIATYTNLVGLFTLTAPSASDTTLFIEGFPSQIAVGVRIGLGLDRADSGSVITAVRNGFDGYEVDIDRPIPGADGTNNNLNILQESISQSGEPNLEITAINIGSNQSRINVNNSSEVTSGDFLSLNNDSNALEVTDVFTTSSSRTALDIVQRGTPSLVSRDTGNVLTTQALFGNNVLQFDTSENDWIEVDGFPGVTNTSDPFTVEMYWVPGSINSFLVPFSLVGTRSGNYNTVDLWYEAARGEWQNGYNNTWSNRQTTNNGTAPVIGTPIHLAFVYSGTAGKFYVDGTEITEIAGGVLNDALSDMTLVIGGTYYSPTGTTINASYYAPGQYDNIRVSNTARYTSNFTRPTTEFTNDANTIFLFNGENGAIADNNGAAIVRSPVDVTIAAGFPATTADAGRFDNIGISLDSVSANSALRADGAFSSFNNITDPFTIEFWYNPTAFSETTAAVAHISGNRGIDGNNTLLIAHNNLDGTYITFGGTNYFPSSVTTYSYGNDAWVYTALSYDGTNARLYVDGNLLIDSVATLNAPLSECTLGIGVDPGIGGVNNNFSRGYYDDLRISNTAKYTGASITVPTAPLVNEIDTVFLLNGNGGLVDDTQIDDYVQFAETTLPDGWQVGAELYFATGFNGYLISSINGNTITLNDASTLSIGNILSNDRTQIQDATNSAEITNIVGNDVSFTSIPSSFESGQELFTRTSSTPQIAITAVNGLDITLNGIGNLQVGDIIDAGTVSTLEDGHTITAINATTNVITLSTIDDNFIVGAEISLRTGTSNAAYTVVAASGTTLTLSGSPAIGRAGNIGINIGDFIGISPTDTNPYEVISGPTANGSDFDYTLGRTIDNINAGNTVFVGTDTDRTLTITAIDYAANTITFDIDPITLGYNVNDRIGLNPPRTGTTKFYVIIDQINNNTITARGDITNAEHRLQVGDILQRVTNATDTSITILNRDDSVANFTTLTVDNPTDSNGDTLRVGDVLVTNKTVTPSVSIASINGNDITINRPSSGFTLGQEIFIGTEDFRTVYPITAINGNTVTVSGSRAPTANLNIGDFVSLADDRFDGPGREITAITNTQITLSNVSGLSIGNTLKKVISTVNRYFVIQSISGQDIELDTVATLLSGDILGVGSDTVEIDTIDTNTNTITVVEASVPSAFAMGSMLEIITNVIPGTYIVSAVNSNVLTLDSVEDLAIGDVISNSNTNADGAEISNVDINNLQITLVAGHGINFAINDTIFKQTAFAAGTYTITTVTGSTIGIDTTNGIRAGDQIGNDDGVVTISSVNILGGSITVSGTIPTTWTINTEIFKVSVAAPSSYEIQMVNYNENTIMLDSVDGIMVGDIYARSTEGETITVTNVNPFTNTITVNNLPDTYLNGDLISEVTAISPEAQAEIKHDNLTGKFRVEDGNWNSTSSYLGADRTIYKTYRFRLIEEL